MPLTSLLCKVAPLISDNRFVCMEKAAGLTERTECPLRRTFLTTLEITLICVFTILFVFALVFLCVWVCLYG